MGLDSRRFILCTDDSHSETLVREGHVDRAVKRAISRGLSPMQAIQMVTINTAEHFGVSQEVGMIAPGRYADILLVDDLVQLSIQKVIARGQIIAEGGKVVSQISSYPYPDWARSSVHLKAPLSEDDFCFNLTGGEGSKIAHVIGVIENQAPTHHLQMEVAIRDGEVDISPPTGLTKIALVERHHASGVIKLGLVHGFGFDAPCAIASTVAHDSHNLIIVGTSEADMAMAGNELARIGGGQVVVRNGEIIGKVALPIAGLMSASPAAEVARQAASVLEGFKACGCNLNNPNMQLSLLALVVIPALRISDKGLVDVEKFDFVPVFEG
jgi:adenine deaminase